ncbi:MAG TPA: bifunctional riboflavin kinase/FAD synthetase [Bacteroidota bacterium]|nr:bifunctional riboflavin kinase/FAD synthetase [Bacteroidota bacterium]
MRVVRSVQQVEHDRNSVVTVGTFDGVHLAHQEILREVVHRARMREGRSIVVTFDPHPKEVVGTFAEPIHLLTTIEERVKLVQEFGVELMLILEFTYEFSRQDARTFYEKYLVNGTGVSEVVVGYDHMFGRDRQGTIEELVRLGKEYDFSVFALHPYTINGEIVSSTQVRRALLAGDVERAHVFLGRPYMLEGIVVRGDGRGRQLGFPTANISPVGRNKLIPARGVYVVEVRMDGRRFFGMMNIGVRPTVTDGTSQVLEVHLFDFDREIYGKELTLSFLKRLRAEQRFTSQQELVRQLASDREASLKVVASLSRAEL